MRLLGQKGIVIMLPVNMEQTAHDLPLQGKRNHAPVAARLALSVCMHGALNIKSVLLKAELRQGGKRLRRQLLKAAANTCALFPRADLVLGKAPAAQKIQAADHNGFSGARLSCQHAQPRGKINIALLDHGNVFNMQ